MAIDLSVVKSIVEAAMQAPSGDNCQPFRFVWKAPILEVHDCPERGRASLNVNNFGTWVALGAALANMELVAAAQGLEITRRLYPSPSLKMADLSFESVPPRKDILLDLVALRTVNRKPYKNSKISALAKSTLSDMVPSRGRVDLKFIEEGPAFSTLVEGIGISDSFSVFNRDVHSFFYRWLRWSETDSLRSKDGMPVKSLELSFFDTIGLWLFKSWNVVQLNSLLGARSFFISRRKSLYRHTAAFGVLSVDAWDANAMVSVGEAVQKLWLKAAQLGLAFHGMMGFPLILHIALTTDNVISAHEKENLLKVDRKIKEAMPILRERKMAFVFRIGEAEDPSARALRRPVEAVLEVHK